MKKHISLVLFLLAPAFLFADFSNYFLDKTMRIDFYHSGNATHEIYSIDEIIEEPFWGGSKTKLTDQFDYGKYKFHVIELMSGKLIYSRGYSSLFAEWQTTEEAKKTWKTFSETVVFPYPKTKVKVEFYSRNKTNVWTKQFEYFVNPENYFIRQDRKYVFDTLNIHYTGDPANKLDIVFLPDGYTKDEMDKFIKDCERFKGFILQSKPFNELQDKINIFGVLAPSEESGTDLPGKDIWKNTLLSTHFYTFDSERYLTSSDNKAIRNVASNAPYDQIIIIVNSEKYGGGGIYNFFTVTSSNHALADFLVIHEFGHSFAGLADEYYSSETSYEEFYSLEAEPWEPNITTLISFDKKWQDMLDPETPVPTPDTKAYNDVVGVFEGGGYVEKNVYRPVRNCTMKSAIYNAFCPVCCRAIEKMIFFYSE